MGLLNLTLGQLLTVFLPLAGMLVALYFYERSRRRVRVSTLRFWPRRPAPPVTRRHRKIQQPLSLLLQLLAILLLLLAVADLRFGSFGGEARRHALILDVSAAMRYRLNAAAGASPIRMDAARAAALDYLDAVPGDDRIALILADAAPRAAVGYTAERSVLRRAIREAAPGWSALDLESALSLAGSSMLLDLDATGTDLSQLDGVGEVVYIGPGRLPAEGSGIAAAQTLPYLRWIDPSAGAEQLEDLGLRQFAARRAADDPSRWLVSVEAINDSPAARGANLSFSFEGRPLGERTLEIPAGGAAEIDFRIRTANAGRLQASLDDAPANDALAENDSVTLALPALDPLPVAVATARPQAWAPLLDANPLLEPVFDVAAVPGGALGVADRQAPNSGDAHIWIDPPADVSPIEVVRRVRNAEIVSWAPSHPLTRGLRETDLRLPAASVLAPQPGDVVLAEVAAGPVAVARQSGDSRIVLLGFDLLDDALANRLTGPLLFANAVGWFAPQAFQLAEVRALPPGATQIDVGVADASSISVETESGSAPTWLLSGPALRLFSSRPGVFSIRTPLQHSRVAMTIPQPGRTPWTPPESVRRGVPPRRGAGLAGVALWPLLALAALVLLAVDWVLFSGASRSAAASSADPSGDPPVGPLYQSEILPDSEPTEVTR